MIINKIKWEDFKTSEWSGGTTTEVLIIPEDSDVGQRNFDIRVSTATCELKESVFSDYSGYKRYIAPVDGELELNVNGRKVLLSPYEVLEFSGSDDVTGYSVVRDYNLIIREGVAAEMISQELSDVMSITLDGNYLLQCFDSDLRYETNNDSGILKKGDALSILDGVGILRLYSDESRFVFIIKY